MPIFAAELDIQFETVAVSGSTPIPDGEGTFTGFGDFPAIDADGNVVFTGTGGPTADASFQSGVYTHVGTCCQKVADRDTLVPGGGGATFDVFFGADHNDIDGGRIAFRADIAALGTQLGVYSNVGQPGPNSLTEIVLGDGIEWSTLGDPWVDGDTVALRGRQLLPVERDTIILWDGSYSFVDPGAGYIVSPGTEASLAGDHLIFRRFQSGSSQLGVYTNGVYEPVVTLGSTPIPGHPGMAFSNVNNYPVVDFHGLDLAFRGTGSGGIQGLYKRVDGGPLEQVVDNATLVPGGGFIPGLGDQIFTLFMEDGLALAGGQTVFRGDGLNGLSGMYTDIGGELSVILDNQDNSLFELDGQMRQSTRVTLGHKSMALTLQGFALVFKVTLATGETAIVRATIDDGLPDPVNHFTVLKDFSDDNTAYVNVSLTCSSGTVTNSPQLAREGAPAVFDIEGASPGTTCTATEPAVPSGYTRDQSDCQDGDPLNGACTIVNTLNASSGAFTVHKDYSDNSSTYVNIHLECSSGTVTNTPQLARENTPAVFEVTGASPGTTCTATEPVVPNGYTGDESDCQDGDPLNGSCTIVNTLISTSDSFTVYKDFSDNTTASVSVHASCTSGTVTNSPQLAREGIPAVFNVTGAAPGTTCTATEPSVPAGYTRNQTDCQDGDPLNGSCTIVNTLISTSNSFTVYKDFSDNNTASVTVTASCSSGTVTNNPQAASEASPAVFTVSGATAGTTCTAAESGVPSGYAQNQSDCQSGRPLNGSCILVNTKIPSGQQQDAVNDGFEDGDMNGWSTSGDVSVSGQTAVGQFALQLRRSSTAEYPVSTAGFSDVTIEMRLAGSSLESGEDCRAEYSANGGGTWTTLLLVDGGDNDGVFYQGAASPAVADNNPNLRLRFRSTGRQPNDYCFGDEVRVVGTSSTSSAGSFVVRKDFSDDNTAGVTVSLACSSGTVTNSPRNASEASPAIFYIQGQSGGATCSASETNVPSGYTANLSGCQDGDPVNGACTLINTLNQGANGTFTVYKDFSDNSAASVTFTASCSSGTVTNSPQQATEGSPAVFNVTGALPGTTCTATEPSVPSGYTRNQTDCQNGDPLNGACTIVNTLDAPPQEVGILHSDFENGQADGWSVGSNVSVDTAVAIGQYALRLQDDGALSERAVSTAGYSGVSVTVRMAATGLEKQDSCLAEYSTNGGGAWSLLLELGDGNSNGTFVTATTSAASVSNNPNLRLRYRLVGKGKGDECYGDEILVTGVP